MTDLQLLSTPAKKVQQALLAQGLAFEVMELASSTRTAAEAAVTLGCEIAHIVKSLIFKTTHSQEAVLVLASGINRVNEKSLEQWVGQALLKAEATFVKEVTGYAIGGVSPVGHATTIPYIFIDQDLLAFEWLWAAAGTPHAVFRFPSASLVALTNGTVVKIC